MYTIVFQLLVSPQCVSMESDMKLAKNVVCLWELIANTARILFCIFYFVGIIISETCSQSQLSTHVPMYCIYFMTLNEIKSRLHLSNYLSNTGECKLNCIYGMTAMQSGSRFLCRLHNGENKTQITGHLAGHSRKTAHLESTDILYVTTATE